MKLLNAVTAVGSGPANISNVPFDMAMTFQVVTTGAPTQVTVDIEGSIDGGTTWESLLTHDVTVNGGMFNITEGSIAVTQLRANLTVLTGGTAPTVTCEINHGV